MPTPSSAPAHTVIPDCCNVGVMFRSLLVVNAAIVCGSLLQAPGWKAGLLEFVDASMVVELASLWSLFALCLTRRGLQSARPARSVPPAAQRLLCGLIPAAVTGAVVH
ncbi:hypothetical protein E4K72_07115, partial [Oxalobacteraceae bacterium OM1]